MKNNEECYIVEDLLLGYFQNLLNPETKKYVEKHLNTCTNCKNKYNYISEQKKLEDKKNAIDEELELNYLKKFNKKILMLKTIIVFFILIILGIVVFWGVKYLYNDIALSKIYNGYTNLKESNNYTMICNETYLEYESKEKDTSSLIYKYKDKKFVSKRIDLNIDIPGYENMDIKNNNITVIGDLEKNEQIIYSNNEQVKVEELEFPLNDTYLNNNINNINEFNDWFYPIIVTIKTDKYYQKECFKECFIVQYKFNKESYRELWFEKETGILVKSIEENYNRYYRERVYEFVEGNVTDEDFEVNHESE